MGKSKPTIAVAGAGYIGLSLSVLLARYNEIYAVDALEDKVKLIYDKKSPIAKWENI